jgi:hypothetical protein
VNKLVIPAVALLVLAGAGCSSKGQEKFKDAPTGARNTQAADIITFPDGFSNVAHKCDGKGHRVYVLFKDDHKYGAIAVVADETCK